MTARRLDIVFAACCAALLVFIFLNYRKPQVVNQTVREAGISQEMFDDLYDLKTRIATLEGAIRPSIEGQEERYVRLEQRLDRLEVPLDLPDPPDLTQMHANKALLDVLIAGQGD